MASFDIDAALRWARFDPLRTLARRRDEYLPFLSEENLGSHLLLLDTCFYIDELQGKSPGILDRVLNTRQVNHSAIAIQELMHAVGALDPRDSRTKIAAGAIGAVVKSMRVHRVFSPDADVLGRAGLLAGIVCRLQGYGSERKMRALQDCVLFLQAQKLGLTVLTRDISDFDVLAQLLPAGRVLFYRRKEGLPV